MRTVELLASIGRIPPQAWDAIIPMWTGANSRIDQVALNPQPLPPVEAFAVSAAAMAHTVARVALEDQVRGAESSAFLDEMIDDWCGTPWPRKFPWPWPGPRGDRGEGPDQQMIELGRISGAIVLASYGTRMAGSKLGEAMIAGAERLAEASVAQQVVEKMAAE